MKPVLQSVLSIFLGSLFMIAFPVMAMTPDGSTPAQEAICDPLMEDGVSKGLYGLCVAFCEANDISDENVPLTEEDMLAIAENMKAPSGRILANYNKKMDENDPRMPCLVPKIEEPACKCFTADELSSIDGNLDGYPLSTHLLYVQSSSFSNATIHAEGNGDITFYAVATIKYGSRQHCSYNSRDVTAIPIQTTRMYSEADGTLTQEEFTNCLTLFNANIDDNH